MLSSQGDEFLEFSPNFVQKEKPSFLLRDSKVKHQYGIIP